jgi:hypothetical protein
VVLAIASRFDEAEAEDILAMTETDAQAALARMQADARQEGRKEGLRISAALAKDAAAHAEANGDPLAQSLFGGLARVILAGAEKETDHD